MKIDTSFVITMLDIVLVDVTIQRDRLRTETNRESPRVATRDRLHEGVLNSVCEPVSDFMRLM